MAAARHRHNGTADQQRQSIDHPSFNLSLDPASLDALAERVADLIADRLPDPEPDRWLTTEEAAQHLAVPVSTLHKMSAAEEVPCSQDRPGGRLYYLRSALDRWRRERAIGPWN